MDAVGRLKELLTHVTYKPGWSLRVVEEKDFFPVGRGPSYDPSNIYIMATWTVKDVDYPDKDIALTWREPIHIWDADNVSDKDLIEHFIFKTIYKAEQHEMHEWFKIDGFCIFDPHPEKKR